MPRSINAVIDPVRLAGVKFLARGCHALDADEMCVMEAVAFVTHQTWTDHPSCVCPVLGAFMRAWNDGLPDSERTALLLPLIPRLVNTRGSIALERRRAVMAADWLISPAPSHGCALRNSTSRPTSSARFPRSPTLRNTPLLLPALTAVRRDVAAARDPAGNLSCWDTTGSAAYGRR